MGGEGGRGRASSKRDSLTLLLRVRSGLFIMIGALSGRSVWSASGTRQSKQLLHVTMDYSKINFDQF